MGQIFACILPCVYQTRVKEFSNIQDERPLKRARHIKRKSSRKDATYKAVPLPGTVISPDKPEPDPLEPNVITLTEKVKAKVAELKIGKSNQDCRQFKKRRLRGKKRGKKKKGKEISQNGHERNRSVVQEAWGVEPGNLLPRPRPQDFYKKTFGPRDQNTREPPTSKEPTKEKSWWKSMWHFPSLNSFFWKTSNYDSETRNGDGDIDKNAGPPQTNRTVVQEAWGLERGNLVPLPRPGDIYRKHLGAKPANTAQKTESPTAAAAAKNEKRWYVRFRVPTLPAFFKRFRGQNSGSESKTGENNGDNGTADEKCHGEVGPSKNDEEGLVTSDYVTAEGCTVKVICVQPLASSSTTSIAADNDKPPLEPEVATSVSSSSQEMRNQEDKTYTLPPLPRPSPWKEMYHKYIRPNELSVQQQHNESNSTESRNLKPEKLGKVKGVRRPKLKLKRRKKKQKPKEQKDSTHDNSTASEPRVRKTKKPKLVKRIHKPKLKMKFGKKKEKEERSDLSLTHEGGAFTASSSSSGTYTGPPSNSARIIQVAEVDETAATPLAVMATTD